ncbi:Putative restriction endonuclease type II, DUF820 [Desulfonema limicola]|uniref:Restriction endonuclease type II, DUF820 n=1 Tax=Desulfonema limicola TaxID=45656 RepID=A0A975B603_9BACT|nr:Uma2 family endonuclease [Desulfonema limicola]QTA79463.1 Putative restriction endonuclease type II, DUF820 [Desulfonema limicola]
MPIVVMEPEIIEIPEPDISHIITEDDTPVDNIFSEKQQRLLAESLNSSWKPGRSFVAAANVGIFHGINQPAIVPDVFLSMDVKLPENIWEKRHRSYFIWEYGKPPDLAVEIVSNTKGSEIEKKIKIYEQICVWYYIVFDPQKIIQKDTLRIYELTANGYIPKIDRNLPRIGLGVKLWQGEYEGRNDLWLRWTDDKGNLIPTGFEASELERTRAAQAEEKAVQSEAKAAQAEEKAVQSEAKAVQAEEKAAQAQTQAEQERAKAEKLKKKLLSLGINPDKI